MANIQINDRDLRKRIREIQDFLPPLRAGKQVPCQFYQYSVSGGRVIAAHGGDPSGSDYLEWKFRSFAKPIWCQYYEIWKPKNNNFLHLIRAYLHIYQSDPTSHSLKEILCIHCDPDDESDEPIRTFKQGPHLHVKAAREPLPKCHFPLNLDNLNRVLSSRRSLTQAFEQAINVVCKEVLKRYTQI